MRASDIKNRNDGIAMIVVLCIMGVFVALSLSILYSASSLVGGSNRQLAQEQARLSALTFSDVVKKQLEAGYDSNGTDVDKGLAQYLYEEIREGYIEKVTMSNNVNSSGDWFYYLAEGNGDHNNKAKCTRSFISEDEKYDAEIIMDIFWTAEDDNELKVYNEQNELSNNFDTISVAGQGNYIRDLYLTVEVTCEYKEETQKVVSVYRLGWTIDDGKETWQWDLEERH